METTRTRTGGNRPDTNPWEAAAAFSPSPHWSVWRKNRRRGRTEGVRRPRAGPIPAPPLSRRARRSGLPYRSSRGFTPEPRVVVALSLPLGVVGRAEIVELELDEEVSPSEVRDRLQTQCPPGLAILDAVRIPRNAGVRVRGL